MTKQATRYDPNRLGLDEAYLRQAVSWGNSRSYGLRLKVGALLVRPGHGTIAEGYNGMPEGFPNEEMELFNEQTGEWYTNPVALHAESNAIIKCARLGVSSEGTTMYATVSPCFDCSKLIIQARIRRVVFSDYFRETRGFQHLVRANIQLVHLPLRKR